MHKIILLASFLFAFGCNSSDVDADITPSTEDVADVAVVELVVHDQGVIQENDVISNANCDQTPRDDGENCIPVTNIVNSGDVRRDSQSCLPCHLTIHDVVPMPEM